MYLDEDIQIYKEILTGKRKRFPNGYWCHNDGKEKAHKLTKFLLEKILNWSFNDICEHLKIETFRKYKLSGMISIIYGDSYYELINEIYPNTFKPWYFSTSGNSYWNLDTAKEATIWLIEEKLKWTDEDIKNNLTGKIFRENGLGGMLSIVFNNSVYETINHTYPSKFKSWEMKVSPMETWNLDTAKNATIWMIDKLGWTDEDIKNNLTGKVFREYGLAGMLSKLFHDSVFLAIDNAYPSKFKSWEMKCAPSATWNKQSAKEATIWLFDEKLKWDFDMIKQHATGNVFKENNLGGMFQCIFKNKTYDALENAYPGVFKPWQLKHNPNGFWKDENNIKECILYILEKKFNKKPSFAEAQAYLTKEVLQQNGAISILRKTKFKNCDSLIKLALID